MATFMLSKRPEKEILEITGQKARASSCQCPPPQPALYQLAAHCMARTTHTRGTLCDRMLALTARACPHARVWLWAERV